MRLSYQFTNKEITPWSGMVFLKQFLDKMRFSEQVSSYGLLLRSGSNRGYSPSVLLESFVYCVWYGTTKFIHTEQTRSDRASNKIFGWKHVSAQDACKRFFRKFTQTDNLRVRQIIVFADLKKSINMIILRFARNIIRQKIGMQNEEWNYPIKLPLGANAEFGFNGFPLLFRDK